MGSVPSPHQERLRTLAARFASPYPGGCPIRRDCRSFHLKARFAGRPCSAATGPAPRRTGAPSPARGKQAVGPAPDESAPLEAWLGRGSRATRWTLIRPTSMAVRHRRGSSRAGVRERPWNEPALQSACRRSIRLASYELLPRANPLLSRFHAPQREPKHRSRLKEDPFRHTRQGWLTRHEVWSCRSPGSSPRWGTRLPLRPFRGANGLCRDRSARCKRRPGLDPRAEIQASTLWRKLRRPSARKMTLKATMAG